MKGSQSFRVPEESIRNSAGRIHLAPCICPEAKEKEGGKKKK